MDLEEAKAIVESIDSVCLFSDQDIADDIVAKLAEHFPDLPWRQLLEDHRTEGV